MKRITKKEILRLKKEYAEDWDYYVECKKSGDADSINRALKNLTFLEATIKRYVEIYKSQRR